MTVCYPQIITASLCPRDELTFSLTPPTCVRVVPVYNDATYVISQFPPPVHFLVRDNGQVYQLADIQSPPSTPPEYHAILDSTGCILVGVELSSVTTTPLTDLQVAVLPGVLRHVLQTLGLPLTSVVNTLPPQRCRPQLWQFILDETQDCLDTPPPPPPPPPGISCSFVRSCISAGQNVDITPGGTISAGQLIPGPNNGEFIWVGPNGTPLFSFFTSSFNLNVQDTNTVDLNLVGNTLSANVNISAASGNDITVNPDGLYVPSTSNPCLRSAPNVAFPNVNDYLVTYSSGSQCLTQLYLNQEMIVYGNPLGSGAPHLQNLFYNPQTNYLRGILNSSANLTNSFTILDGSTISATSSYNVISVLSNSSISQTFVNSLSAINNSSNFEISNSLVTQTSSSVPITYNSTSNLINSSVDSTIRGSYAHLEDSAGSSINFSLSVLNNSLVGNIFGSAALLSSSTIGTISHSLITARNSNESNSIFSFSVLTSDETDWGAYSHQNSTVHAISSSFQSSFINSFASVSNSTVRGAINTLLISSGSPQIFVPFNSILITNQVVNANRVGLTTPNVFNSHIQTTSNIVPESYNVVYVSSETTYFRDAYNSLIIGNGLVINDPNPPNNSATVENSVIVGRELNLSNVPLISGLLLVGRNLQAGTQTVFGVGYSVYTTPAIQSAGGWRAYIADGGDAQTQNYFQGWASAWRFRPFNPGTNYANDAAAITALNTSFGTDPRLAWGTMVVAQVAGSPAIFTWNGTTFVRITV